MLNETALQRLCDACPNLVGFKDGHGDIELMTRICARLGQRLVYIGGLPHGGSYPLPLHGDRRHHLLFGDLQLSARGLRLEFYAAVCRRDRAAVLAMLRDFVLPYIAIRGRRKGYAVSIVKAGLKAVGRPAGPVRLPSTDLEPGEFEELKKLIAGRG